MNRALHAPPILTAGLVALVVLFTNLGGPRLWDRDEPRNAGCAREMLQRGDWVTPVFNGELRNHKPVLLYWLIMSAYSVLGVNEFAARFWSAALGTGTVLLTYGMGKHLFGTRAGLWSAIGLATSLMFCVAGRAATPDALLIFCTTLGMFFYVRGSLPSPMARSAKASDCFPRDWRHAALIYGSFALGVLAKGPVALVLPIAVIGAYLLIVHVRQATPRHGWRRYLRWPAYFAWTCWRMRPLTALGMLLIIAVPWYVWVGVRTEGQFLWEFFVEHNLNRARQPMEGHDGPFFYYMLAILPGFFPWSVFLVPTMWNALGTIRRHDSMASGIWFCAAWMVVWIGAFSLAGTKLPSYVTPCYPALALLTGWFLDRWIADRACVPSLWPRLGIGVLAAVGLSLIVILPIVAHYFLPHEKWLALIGLVPLLGAAGAALMLRRERRASAVASMGISAVAFALAVFALAAQRVDSYQQSDRLLHAAQARGSRVELGAYGCLEPSWVFYANQPIEELSDAKRFLHERHDRCIITTREYLPKLNKQLPVGTSVLAEVPYFLKDEHLVLIGYTEQVQTARR